MAFPTIIDRNVQYPSRVQLTEVSAGVYDTAAVPGTTVEVGTPINRALFTELSAHMDATYPMSAQILAAATKATPSDTDLVGYIDNTNAHKKLTWADIKTLFALAARGVTNGDAHAHTTGDGGQITISTLAGLAPTWHLVGGAGEPAFANSWVNVAGARAMRFSKDAFGFVHLEGRISGGASAAAAFTLPVGYRPGALIIVPLGGAGNALRADISGTGVVTPTWSVNGAVAFSSAFYAG